MRFSSRKFLGEEVIVQQYERLAEEILDFGDGLLKCNITDDTGRKFLALMKAGKLDSICEDEFFDAHNFTVKLRVTAFVEGVSSSKPEFSMKASDLKRGIALIRDSLPFITSHTEFKKFLTSGILLRIESGKENGPLFLVTI